MKSYSKVHKNLTDFDMLQILQNFVHFHRNCYTCDIIIIIIIIIDLIYRG